MDDHSHHAAEHAHAHGVGMAETDAQQRALVVALVVTSVFVVIEVVGGIAFGSLALAADAAHMFSDAVALAIAVAAQRLARRPASLHHSFGWRRAEVLAALVNGLALVAVSGWIVFEAVGRFSSPPHVDAPGMVTVALLGLVANLGATWVLHRAPGHNLNVRAAALHTMSDAAGSLGAVVAGVVIAAFGWHWADPMASVVIAVLVVLAARGLVRDATHVLLEGTPRHLDPGAVERALRDGDQVVAVHHLHLWSLAPEVVALSAHVELNGPMTLHEAQARGEQLKVMLAERFDVQHSTLELECHPCDPDPDGHA